MEKTKLRHGLAIAVLIALTAAVLAVLAQTKRSFPSVDVPAVTHEAVLETAASVSEAFSAPAEAQTEWIPPIEYDEYTPSEIDTQSFRDTVVLGNSQAQALQNFGLMQNVDFVTRIGLSIHKVLSDGTATPPIASLYGKQYRKAVFVFGENELGWPYPKNFISHYKKVIDKVREMNPGVAVYCQAIFPVSAESSAKSTTGITNENVRKFNAMIEEMCGEIGATFMPYASAFVDPTGALPEGAAFDGVHFGYDYCKIWAGDLSAYLAGSNTATYGTQAAMTSEGVTEP